MAIVLDNISASMFYVGLWECVYLLNHHIESGLNPQPMPTYVSTNSRIQSIGARHPVEAVFESTQIYFSNKLVYAVDLRTSCGTVSFVFVGL